MNKKNKLPFIFAIMVLSGIFGWIYEIIFYYINSGFKNVYMRGITFGPWIDIYVIGGLLIYLLNKNTKSKLKVFIKSGIICGLLEFLSGYMIYTLFDGKRSWNYNTEILNFGNINGFICFRSVLFFALSGLILMFIIVPFVNKMFNSKFNKYFKLLFIILFIIFIIDEIYNMLIVLKVLKLPSASKIYVKLGFKYWKS